jgi:hypothetical protein
MPPKKPFLAIYSFDQGWNLVETKGVMDIHGMNSKFATVTQPLSGAQGTRQTH